LDFQRRQIPTSSTRSRPLNFSLTAPFLSRSAWTSPLMKNFSCPRPPDLPDPSFASFASWFVRSLFNFNINFKIRSPEIRRDYFPDSLVRACFFSTTRRRVLNAVIQEKEAVAQGLFVCDSRSFSRKKGAGVAQFRCITGKVSSMSLRSLAVCLGILALSLSLNVNTERTLDVVKAGACVIVCRRANTGHEGAVVVLFPRRVNRLVENSKIHLNHQRTNKSPGGGKT